MIYEKYDVKPENQIIPSSDDILSIKDGKYFERNRYTMLLFQVYSENNYHIPVLIDNNNRQQKHGMFNTLSERMWGYKRSEMDNASIAFDALGIYGEDFSNERDKQLIFQAMQNAFSKAHDKKNCSENIRDVILPWVTFVTFRYEEHKTAIFWKKKRVLLIMSIIIIIILFYLR